MTGMQRLVATCLVFVMLGGCMTYRGSRKAAKVGAWMLVPAVPSTLLILAGAGANYGGAGPSTGTKVVVGVALLGMASLPVAVSLVLGGMVGMAIHPTVTPEEREAQEVARQQEQARVQQANDAVAARERAWTLSKEASAAARTGDCTGVEARAIQIREIDRDFHDTVFLRDVAIKRCMDAKAARENQPSPEPRPSLMRMRPSTDAPDAP